MKSTCSGGGGCQNDPRRNKRLSQRINIERPITTAVDANNQLDESTDANWTLYFTCLAYYRPAFGRERFADDQTVATRNVIFEVASQRPTRQCSTTYRVKYIDRDGETHRLGIMEVRQLEDGKTVQLHCAERAA